MKTMRSFLKTISLFAMFAFLGGCTFKSFIRIGSDITGPSNSEFGHSVAIRSKSKIGAGSSIPIVGIGAPNNSNNSGLVRVYKYENNSWSQIGQDLTGPSNSKFGYSISINKTLEHELNEETLIAIGAPSYDSNKGLTQVYKYNQSTNQWEQLGSDIIGATTEMLGHSVSISKITSYPAYLTIGAPKDDSETGYVQNYRFNETTQIWDTLGPVMKGAEAGDNFGFSVSGSDTTLTSNIYSISIGTPHANNFRGLVYQYSYEGSWSLDSTLHGEHENDLFGYSVSEDSTSTLIGAPGGSYSKLYNKQNLVKKFTKETGSLYGNSVSNQTYTDPNTLLEPNFAIGAPANNFAHVFASSSHVDSKIEKDISGNDQQFFGAAISFERNLTDKVYIAIGAPSSNTVRIFKVSDETFVPQTIHQIYREAIGAPAPTTTGSSNNTGGTSGSSASSITLKTLHQKTLEKIHNQEVIYGYRSQLTVVFESDTGTNTEFKIQGGQYHGGTFTCTGLEGSVSANSDGTYTFTQQSSTEIEGTLKDSQGNTISSTATLSDTTIHLTSEHILGNLTDNTLTITDLQGGTITSGTFTVDSITLDLVSDTSNTSYLLNTTTAFPQFPSGTTFEVSGFDASSTLTGGTLNGGQTELTGTTVTQMGPAVTGTLTIPSGTYAGTYPGVTLTGATIQSATVTGSTSGGTFSGTNISAGQITAGTLGIVFVDIPDTTSASFTIDQGGLGEFDGKMYELTSGTISGYILGTPSSIISGGTTISGESMIQVSGNSVLGNIDNTGGNPSTTFTNVPLANAPFSTVSLTGTVANTNIFTTTSFTSGTIDDTALLIFFIDFALTSDTGSTAYTIDALFPQPGYAGGTFTCSGIVGNIGPAIGGTFSSATIYTGGFTDVIGGVSGTISGTASNDGPATLDSGTFPPVPATIENANFTGSFTGLLFQVTDITSGNIVTGEFS